jgi:hypothetical protein
MKATEITVAFFIFAFKTIGFIVAPIQKILDFSAVMR